MAYIKVSNLSKSFGKSKVLDGINLEINPGDFAVLVGQNGSGKSTILNLLAQNIFHDDGMVTIFDQELGHSQQSFYGDLAYVHENFDIKVPYNIDKFIQMFSSNIENWDQELFERMIEDRELDLSKKYSNYSRGQKMQFSLIFSLAQKPKVLLIDEITAVIDLIGQKYFLTYLQQFASSGGAVIMTTNIISEAQNFCNKVIYLRDGKISESGHKKEMIDPFIKLEIPHHLITETRVPHHCTLVERTDDHFYYILEKKEWNEVVPDGCRLIPVSLEDVFIHKYSFKEKYANAS